MFEKLLLAATFTLLLSLFVRLKVPAATQPASRFKTLEQPTETIDWPQRSAVHL